MSLAQRPPSMMQEDQLLLSVGSDTGTSLIPHHCKVSAKDLGTSDVIGNTDCAVDLGNNDTQQKKQCNPPQRQLKPPLFDSKSGGGQRNAVNYNKASLLNQGQIMSAVTNVIIKENTPATPMISNGRVSGASNGTAERLLGFGGAMAFEQALFEQRLCDENYGVAIRKINQYGKSNLRYVKCIFVDVNANLRKSGSWSLSSHSQSASSWGRNSSNNQQQGRALEKTEPYLSHTSRAHEQQVVLDQSTNHRRVLAWGKKKYIQVPLDCFVCVRKGKTTERARKNPVAASRILSLITNDPSNITLDIEAPSKNDRDKFARAFAQFLSVPLEDGDVASEPPCEPSTSSLHQLPVDQRDDTQGRDAQNKKLDALNDIAVGYLPLESGGKSNPLPTAVTLPSVSTINSDLRCLDTEPSIVVRKNLSISPENDREIAAIVDVSTNQRLHNDLKLSDNDDVSHVSSLTGNAYDQELVEELHHALNELRSELEESRAEAARAVKVAEQAIQSAERSNSIDWQNTVTHKAAEAAAKAQKQSAVAMAKARVAEERLEGERRTAQFWRKQAEVAEDEAGMLHTRVAAAEVQRAALEEQLKLERRLLQSQNIVLKERFLQADMNQRQILEQTIERNRSLELELDAARRELVLRQDVNDTETELSKATGKKKRSFGRKKKTAEPDHLDSMILLSSDALSPGNLQESRTISGKSDSILIEKQLQLASEVRLMKREFEMMRRLTVDDFRQLPAQAKIWSNEITKVVKTFQGEVSGLQEQLSMVSASRRKLLREVQELRGKIRVFCRPYKFEGQTFAHSISVVSSDTLIFHRQCALEDGDPDDVQSFEYDHVFPLGINQHDLFTEIEDTCLTVLDGYNICILAFGPANCGKTHTLLGQLRKTDQNQIKVRDYGVQLRLLKELFEIAENRKERYKDTFVLTLVEVYDEKLCDLFMGTEIAEKRGMTVSADAKNRKQKLKDDNNQHKSTKLEIRTDINGQTIVQGLLSVQVQSFDEVIQLWEDCLTLRERRLIEQGVNRTEYQASCHLISTLTVVSTNVATGIGTIGKIQFVDLASVDVEERVNDRKSLNPNLLAASSPDNEFRFSNRSLQILNELVQVKAQFEQVLPYRNSTLTHLLQDSFEGDTKVMFLNCVSTNALDLAKTEATLVFASLLRRLSVGNATKHTFSSKGKQSKDFNIPLLDNGL